MRFFGADESKLKNGDLIVATGTPRYYVKGGKLNFNVVKVEPYGVGELYKRFLETKDRLEREGLFLQSHKIQIPENVKKIGVVTSEKARLFAILSMFQLEEINRLILLFFLREFKAKARKRCYRRN